MNGLEIAMALSAPLIVLSLQVTGTVPTVSIDKTDGCMVYLSKSSINAVFVTAKSSEMNVLVPDESGEFVSSTSVSFIQNSY